MSGARIDPVALAAALVRCESVTPVDDGALDLVQMALSEAGFHCIRLPFGPPGPERVDNLFARFGEKGPHLCFAGHVDVVPTGRQEDWSFPPFSGEVRDGYLLGRGAADMKGAIGAMAAAALRLVPEIETGKLGSVSLLLTGDEEGPSLYGTLKLVEWLTAQGEKLDFAIVGEPTSVKTLGDTIKIGRRGSLNVALRLQGRQGHVAYPEKARNPVPGLLSLLHHLPHGDIDAGSERFAPSRLEVTALASGTGAFNVIPADGEAKFNIRFSDAHDFDSLEVWMRGHFDKARIDYELDLQKKGVAFLTAPGPLTDAVSDAVRAHCGLNPELSTSGGTSDARFLKDLCPVVELGLINETIHAVDERVSAEDIATLADIYESAARRLIARE